MKTTSSATSRKRSRKFWYCLPLAGQKMAIDDLGIEASELISRLWRTTWVPVVLAVRELRDSGVDVGVVVGGKSSAYIERTDRAFRAEAEKCYAELQSVDDLLTALDDDVLKVAVYDFGSAEHTTAPALSRFRATHQVVVSGEHWVDIMNLTANKGEGIRHLLQAGG